MDKLQLAIPNATLSCTIEKVHSLVTPAVDQPFQRNSSLCENSGKGRLELPSDGGPFLSRYSRPHPQEEM